MKKLFLAFALLLFTSTTFAATLSGKITDKIADDNENLVEVSVTLGTNPAILSKDEGYTFSDFQIPASGSSVDISFVLAGYEDLTGTIKREEDELLFNGETFADFKNTNLTDNSTKCSDPELDLDNSNSNFAGLKKLIFFLYNLSIFLKRFSIYNPICNFTVI